MASPLISGQSRECAIRPGRTLPVTRSIISSIISKRQRKTVIAGERAHNHEARSTSAQIAEGPERWSTASTQAQEKGTKHNRFVCSARGLSGYKTFALYPQKATATSLYNAFTEHQRQFLTEKDGTIALAAFHEFCTIIAAHPQR
jgi:hypothetical protein